MTNTWCHPESVIFLQCSENFPRRNRKNEKNFPGIPGARIPAAEEIRNPQSWIPEDETRDTWRALSLCHIHRHLLQMIVPQQFLRKIKVNVLVV